MDPIQEQEVLQTVDKNIVIKELVELLVKQFPNCFAIDKTLIKPLKIGILEDLFVFFDTYEPKVSRKNLRNAIRFYTQSWQYLSCFKKGQVRVDLQGNEVAPLTDEEITEAQNRLNESRKSYQEKFPKVKKPQNKFRRKAKKQFASQSSLDALKDKFSSL